jgi:hypothetical protein
VYEPNHTTVITDDPAAVDEYHHEQGLVTAHVNALGHARHWHYNQHLELEAEQDALGQPHRLRLRRARQLHRRHLPRRGHGANPVQ